MSIAILTLFAAAVLITLVMGWLLAQLTRQADGIDCRLTSLEHPERRDRRIGFSFQPNTLLNDFELPTLAGGMTRFSAFRGQRVGIVFVHPNCRFSRELLSLLAESTMPLPAGRPMPLVVSTGDRATNLALVGGTVPSFPFLLQEGSEVADVMRVFITPSAYVVDGHAVTEQAMFQGARAVAAALGITPERAADRSSTARDSTMLPDVAPKRLKALGLGAAAPVFELLSLEGDRITVGGPSSRSTVVVLSDPDCPPCTALARTLAAQAATKTNLVIVASGEPEAIDAFAATTGLRAPIVRQSGREVSRAFGTLETPAAFLIAPDGSIAAPVAIGTDAVLALARQS